MGGSASKAVEWPTYDTIVELVKDLRAQEVVEDMKIVVFAEAVPEELASGGRAAEPDAKTAALSDSKAPTKPDAKTSTEPDTKESTQSGAGASQAGPGGDEKGDEKVRVVQHAPNSIDAALQCLGSVVGTAPVRGYLFGAAVAILDSAGPAADDDKKASNMLALPETRGASDLVAKYRQRVDTVSPSPSTASDQPISIAAPVLQAIEHAKRTQQFHLAVIAVRSALLPDCEAQREAFELAARYPISFCVVKVGVPLPETAVAAIESPAKRLFANARAVNYGPLVAALDQTKREGAAAMAILSAIPSQYATIRKLQGYHPASQVVVYENPAWAEERQYQATLRGDAKLLVLGRTMKTAGPIRIGRGARWVASCKTLLFTDLLGKHMYAYRPASQALVAINARGEVACALTNRRGEVLLGTSTGIERVGDFDLKTADPKAKPDFWIHPYTNIEKRNSSTRATCGATDAKGRFWIATGPTGDEAEGAGSLYCCAGEGNARRTFSLGDTSGLAFSRDGSRLYIISFLLNSVLVSDVDAKTGNVSSPRELFKATTRVRGRLSGVALDEEGKLWVGHWGGGAVVRYDPDNEGRVLKILRIPTILPSSLAFGGERLERLFVVCGSETVSMKREYYGGSLFVLEEPGVRGAPITPYGFN